MNPNAPASAEFDYVEYHIERADELAGASGKSVLVVGCNRGREVASFIERGARAVTGIDVLLDVGADFPDPRASYHRMSAEAMDLPDDSFDIVYCVATMEHVAHPAAAFAEIARVTAPRGLAYVLSAPLWHSRQGHHKPELFDVTLYPWLHLRYTADEIKAMCASGEITADPATVGPHVEYMLDRANMNQLPARSYVAAAASLPRMIAASNDLDLEGETVLELLPESALAGLAARGIDAVELRALTHAYIGWKDEMPTATPAQRSGRRPRACGRLWRRFAGK